MKLANMITARRNQTRIIVQQNQKRPYRRQSLFNYLQACALCFAGRLQNLLRGPISSLRCSLYGRTVALLDTTSGRSLRLLEAP